MKSRLLCTGHVFLSFFLLSLLASSHGEVQTCVQPPSDLVSWWSGDGNAGDIQNVNDGTLQGGATFVAGMVGQAFSFDGVDDFVEAPENGSLDFNGSFTVDLWVRPNGSTPDGPMVSKYDFSQGFPNVAYEFSLWPGGQLQFVVTCGTTNMNRRTAPGVNPVPADEFSHVTAVYRQEIPRLEIYVNGRLQPGNTNRSCSFINQNDIPFRIGKRIGSGEGERFFHGLIDEVEIFNRALEPEEILAIYNAGSTGKCKGVVITVIDIEPDGTEQECSEQGGTNVQLTAEVNEGFIASVTWMIDGILAGDTETITPFLALGQHSVQVDVVTDNGSTGSATETITVADTTPPQIEAAFVDPDSGQTITQIPPNNREISPEIHVTDVCDSEPVVDASVGIPSESGDTFRVKQVKKSTSIASDTNPDHIELSVSAKDASGNTATENIQLELVK